MLAMQKELLTAYEQISQAWLARVQSEVDLWSDLATRVSSIRSAPEALAAWQECAVQRMKMAADDGRRLLEDSQKIMTTVTRAISSARPAALK
jgi:hypothetical protein